MRSPSDSRLDARPTPTGGGTVTDELNGRTARALGDLARRAASDRDLDGTLDAIVASAAQTMRGVAAVGISYLDDGNVVARAQSSSLVTEVDDLQNRIRQGPCLQVLTAGDDMVLANDLNADPRWPEFCAVAVGCGVRSALSFRLFVDHVTLGNLTFFGGSAGAFDGSSELIGELYATHAAVALSGVRLEQQFNQAIRRRDVIGQAKGVLMAQHGLDEETAFATLVRFSQTEHVKLYDVARQLLDAMETERAKPPPA
jgi:transcriptional regulator with GAF, ATPase, and Fis domain